MSNNAAINNFTAKYSEETESVVLTWKASTESMEGNVSYIIYKDYIQYDNTSELTYKDVGISPGATYCYEVAMVVNGKEVAYSEEVEVTIPENIGLLVYTSKGYYNAIAKRIQKYIGNRFKYFPMEFPIAIDEVFNSGQKKGEAAEYKRHWDEVQGEGNRGSYAMGFYAYPVATLNPYYDIVIDGNYINAGYRTFMNSKIVEILKPIIVKNGTVGQQVFQGCSLLQKLILLDLTDYTGEFSSWWSGCSALVSIIVKGFIKNSFDIGDSPLNKESFISVIEHLDDSVSGMTVTFKKSAINEAFGIDVDDESTWPEGSEYYNLRYSKSNWTVFYK